MYADEFIRLLKKLVLGDGHNLAHMVWLEAVGMKRSQYGTIEQFIAALRDKVQHSNRVDMPITAYQAASLLLKNIHRELPNYVEAKFLELSKIPRKDFMMQQFRGLCEEARDQARGMANVYSATPVQMMNQSQSQTQSRPDFKKTREARTHQPEKGVDIHEYVRKWRASNKKTFDGNCGYCEESGHLPTKCPYLNVELRSDNWKPNPNLWVYFINWKTNTEWKSKQISSLPPKVKPVQSSTSQTPAASTVPYDDEDSDVDFSKLIPISMAPPIPFPTEVRMNRVHHKWIADTGSGRTLCTDWDLMVTYEEIALNSPGFKYLHSGGGIGEAKIKGTCRILLQIDNNTVNELIVKCYYVPGLSYNLFGLQRAKDEYGIAYNTEYMNIYDIVTRKTVGYCHDEDGVAICNTTRQFDDTLTIAPYQFPWAPQMAMTAFQIHRRLAHCGKDRRKETLKYLDAEEIPKKFNCEACKLAKAKKIISHDKMPEATQPGQKMHFDVFECKPIGIHGYRYFLLLTDDNTKAHFLCFMARRSEASTHLKTFSRQYHNSTKVWINYWHSDGAKEFNDFITWGKQKGMQFEISPPRAHEANGKIERHGGYILQTYFGTTFLPSGIYELLLAAGGFSNANTIQIY